MANPTALMGLGLSGGLASLLGYEPSSKSGAGTTQGTATAITSKLTLATASGGATGVILPSTANVGSIYLVASLGATATVVYCPSGHTLNGTTNGAATFQATPGLAVFIRTSTTAWVCAPTTSATVTVA